jgi:hypothetical protein
MLTLEEYEKLNPRCEITHQGTRVVFATPTAFTKWRVDVDGFEPRVIVGARRGLAERKLRSLLIEVNQNLADHRQMVAELESLGFRYDRAQVAAAGRTDGPFKGVAEYVFKR